MARYRRQIAAAVALNIGIFVAEAAAGYRAGSLALITNSVHNLFDELALVCIYLAFIWSRRPSRWHGSPQAREEQLLRCDGPRSEILLMHISADGRPGRPIGLQTIGPEVSSERGPRLLHMADEPRQRHAQCIGVVKAADRHIARRAERLVYAGRHPRMLAMHILAHDDDVHDGKDSGAAIIVLFDVAVVGKHARDERRALQEQRRDIERKQRIEFAG